MKILYCGVVLYYGGGPRMVVNIASRLSESHNVEVLEAYGRCEEFLKSLGEKRIPVHIAYPKAKHIFAGYHGQKVKRAWSILKKFNTYKILYSKLSRMIRSINPDVIWTNTKYISWMIGVNPALKKYPLLRAVIEYPSPKAFQGFYGRILRKRVDVVVAVSSQTADCLREAGISESLIHVVPDTLDYKRFIEGMNYLPAPPLPGIDGYPKLLLPAQILPLKCQDTAIRTVANLVSAGLKPTLWLAGGIAGNDETYNNFLHQLVKELGLQTNVFFLGHRHDIPSIYAQTDVVIFPSATEGFGLIALEAMLARKPIVATPVGGICDQINDGTNGLLVPVRDEKQLAKAIMRLMSDEKLVRKLVNNGYSTFFERFLPEHNTEGFICSLQAAVQRRKQRLSRL